MDKPTTASKSTIPHLPTITTALAVASLSLATLLGRAAEPATTTPSGPASDAEVLLNLFQKKGLVSEQDAKEAREALAARHQSALAAPKDDSKIHIAKWIEGVDLYGDARLRFEHRNGENTAGDHIERNRWRYRLRGGARMEFTDNLRAGVQLETGSSGRSSNVTFGDDAGPFGKSSDGIFLGLLYLNWTPTDWLSVTAGRQTNPFKTTSLVWDHDLAPEGLTEAFTHKAGAFDLFATFGQYIYDDANPNNVFGSGASISDAFLFVNQIGARYNFNKNVSAQIAPLLHVYSGEGDSFNVPFAGSTVANSVGINDLMVLSIPAEVKFKLSSLPVRVFGDFAVNLDGENRALAAGTPTQDDEIYAWQAGLELGSAKKKGGWSLKAFYQQSDLYALDNNLVDSDLFDSRLNMRGVVVQGTYAFTDFLTLNLSYANAERNNTALPTGAIGDLGLPAGTSTLEKFQLFQVDLNFKF